ncbi:MAG: LacI family DNA-binding transcriptional regulator [Halanaerobiales bacterium]|nr:LacI family DNA-binding transcriptional regulator [Halanaerobiales bacterium]
MGVTIKDVAKLANVSPSTVSRVIAGNKRISLATHEKVKKAMDEIGYYPNANARSLVNNSTEMIGLVLSRSVVAALSNPFFPEIIRGITSIAQKYGYSLLLSSSKDHFEEEEEALRMLRERRVDGLLVLASRVNDSLIQKVQHGNHPIVLVGRVPNDDELYWVNNDNVESAKKAVTYLTELGHQKIGLLSGSMEYIMSQDRLEGYQLGLSQAGISYDSTLIEEVEFTVESGTQGMMKLLEKHPDLTAVFATDDILAIGAIQMLKNKGLAVPKDISVIGFNDGPFASYIDPSLTTIRIPIYEMGVTAVGMLIKIIKGEEISQRQVSLSTELIIRDSCKQLD